MTISFTLIFSVVILAYLCGASALLYWQLNDQLYKAEVQDEETVEGLLFTDAAGNVQLNDDYHNRADSKLLLDRLLEVVTPQGEVLFRNEKLNGVDLGGRPLPREITRGYYARRLKLADGRTVLAISHYHAIEGRWVLIRVAYSTEPLKIRVLEFVATLGLALPFALIAAGFAGYRMAGKALNPLRKMTETAAGITANRLADRLQVENANDEFGRMAQVLNGLLNRLEESFGKLKGFTSDVSHELRMPLASLRSVGEVGLQREHTAGEYRDIIGSMLEEVQRLTSIVDTLLTIARADAGEIELRKSRFRISELVEETVQVVGVLAEEKGQEISFAGNLDVAVLADRGFMRMALMNLLDNAVKYSPVGASIRVTWNETGRRDLMRLTVEDQGPGIAEEKKLRIFDRFYRVDEGRARNAGGAGLGLAIAKWAVDAHNGSITVKSRPGGGSAFMISLPLTAN